MRKLYHALTIVFLFLVVSPVHATNTHALRGFVANNPASVNVLVPEWFQTDFGTWLMSYNFGAAKLVLNMTNSATVPSAADLTLLTTHPNYRHWWMLGINESDINGYTSGQTLAQITAQGNAILAVDPSARFSVMGLSQAHPLSSVYFWHTYNRIPDNIKARIFSFNVHWYVQAAGVPDSQTFSAQPIKDMLADAHTAMQAHGVDDLELWVTEIGLVKTTYTNAHLSDVANYPNVLQAAMDGRADRYAIYAEYSWAVAASYFDLENVDTSVTDMGNTFIALGQ